MGRALVNWLPFLVVIVGLLIVARLMGFLASLQARACLALLFLLVLFAVLVWLKYRKRAMSDG